MITDDTIKAAGKAFLDTLDLNDFYIGDDVSDLTSVVIDGSGDIAKAIRAALEAAEAAAWRPISQIPNDEMLMVLARNAVGWQMVWRASMLHRQHHHRTPQHLDFGATEFRAVGHCDAPISAALPPKGEA